MHTNAQSRDFGFRLDTFYFQLNTRKEFLNSIVIFLLSLLLQNLGRDE